MTIFDFAVRYLGFLKKVPLMPHLFDTALRLQSLLFYPAVSKAIDEVEKTVGAWPDISKSLHPFGGVQFNYKGKELGHIHGNGLVDIRVNTRLKAALMNAGLAQEHHLLKSTGWISYFIRSQTDAGEAVRLFQITMEWRMSGNIHELPSIK